MPGSNTYFLEMSAKVSLDIATKDSFEIKKYNDLAFLRLFF